MNPKVIYFFLLIFSVFLLTNCKTGYMPVSCNYHLNSFTVQPDSAINLRDFKMYIKPGKTEEQSIYLLKKSIYSLYFYHCLYPFKKEIKASVKIINPTNNNTITELQFGKSKNDFILFDVPVNGNYIIQTQSDTKLYLIFNIGYAGKKN